MLSPELQRTIDEAVEAERPALAKLAKDIHQNPELRFEEQDFELIGEPDAAGPEATLTD